MSGKLPLQPVSQSPLWFSLYILWEICRLIGATSYSVLRIMLISSHIWLVSTLYDIPIRDRVGLDFKILILLRGVTLFLVRLT